MGEAVKSERIRQGGPYISRFLFLALLFPALMLLNPAPSHAKPKKKTPSPTSVAYTPTAAATPTVRPSPTATTVPTPTSSFTPTFTSIPTATATLPPTATPTTVPPFTPTAFFTATPVFTPSPQFTATAEFTPTPLPTATAPFTPTPVWTTAPTPRPTATSTLSYTPGPEPTSIVPTVPPTIAPPPSGSLSLLAPIFRIDVMNSEAGGSHLYGYVTGEPVFSTGGFYGQDTLSVSSPCDSYKSVDGAYSTAVRRPKCQVSSSTIVNIHQNASIYGSALSLGTVNSSPPWGGKVCADFQNGCPNPGVRCEGPDCEVPQFETFKPWQEYCPSNQGNVSVTAGTTLTVAGDDPGQKCWSKVSVSGNATLTLTSTQYPYFIETLDTARTAFLRASPDLPSGVITLYVNKITGDKLENQILNDSGRPCQLHIIYLGTAEITVGSGADLLLRMTAPYSVLALRAKFDYFGAIRAKELKVSNLTSLHYDESCNDRFLKGMRFRMRKEGEVYR